MFDGYDGGAPDTSAAAEAIESQQPNLTNSGISQPTPSTNQRKYRSHFSSDGGSPYATSARLPFAISGGSADEDSVRARTFLQGLNTYEYELPARYNPQQQQREAESESGSQIPVGPLRQLTNDTFMLNRSPPLPASTPSVFGQTPPLEDERQVSGFGGSTAHVPSQLNAKQLSAQELQQESYQSQMQDILNATTASADEVRSPVALKRRPTLVTLTGGMPFLVDTNSVQSLKNQMASQRKSSILLRRPLANYNDANNNSSMVGSPIAANVYSSFAFGRESVTVLNNRMNSSVCVVRDDRQNNNNNKEVTANNPSKGPVVDHVTTLLDSSTNSFKTTFKIRGSLVDVQLPKLSTDNHAALVRRSKESEEFISVTGLTGVNMKQYSASNVAAADDESVIFEREAAAPGQPDDQLIIGSEDRLPSKKELQIDRVLSMLNEGSMNKAGINRQGIVTGDATIVSRFSNKPMLSSNNSANSKMSKSDQGIGSKGNVDGRKGAGYGHEVVPATAAEVEKFLEEHAKEYDADRQKRREWRLGYLVDESRRLVEDEHLVDEEGKLNLDEEDQYWPVFLTFLCVCVLIGIRMVLDREENFEGYVQLSEISLVFTGMFYMLSNVFRNVNQDYKEAEKIPMDIVSSLRQVLDGFDYSEGRFHTAWRKDVVNEMKKIEAEQLEKEKKENEERAAGLALQATKAFQPPLISGAISLGSTPDTGVAPAGTFKLNLSVQQIGEVESLASTTILATSNQNTPQASVCQSKVKSSEEDVVTAFLREGSFIQAAVPPTNQIAPLPSSSSPPIPSLPPTNLLQQPAPPPPPPPSPPPIKVFRPPIDGNIARVLVLQCAREALLTLRTDYSKPIHASMVKRRQKAGMLSESKEGSFCQTSTTSSGNNRKRKGDGQSLANERDDTTNSPQQKYQKDSRGGKSENTDGGGGSDSEIEMDERLGNVTHKKNKIHEDKNNDSSIGGINRSSNKDRDDDDDHFDNDNGCYYYNPHGDCLSTLRELSILLNLWDRSTPSAVAPSTNNGLAYTNLAIDKTRRMLNRATVIRRTDVLPAARALLIFFVLMACFLILVAIYKTDAGLFFVIAAVASTAIFMTRLIIKMDDPFLVKLHFMGNHTHTARESAKVSVAGALKQVVSNLTTKLHLKKHRKQGGTDEGQSQQTLLHIRSEGSGGSNQPIPPSAGDRRLSFVPSHKRPHFDLNSLRRLSSSSRGVSCAAFIQDRVTRFVTFMYRLLFSERLAFVQDYPLVEFIRELELELEES